ISSDFERKPGQSFATFLAITSHIDAQASVVIAEATLTDDSRQILHGQQRRTFGADQEPKVIANDIDVNVFAINF
ncbi:MAG: hypothetical protein ACKPAJ_12000, partial [Actinomycetota bacterium]